MLQVNRLIIKKPVISKLVFHNAATYLQQANNNTKHTTPHGPNNSQPKAPHTNKLQIN